MHDTWISKTCCFFILLSCFCLGCSSDIEENILSSQGFIESYMSDDGDLILTTSINGITDLWERESGKKIFKLPHVETNSKSVKLIALSQDGDIAVTLNKNSLLVWDNKLKKAQANWQVNPNIIAIKLSESGNYALLATYNSVDLLNLETGTLIWSKHIKNINKVDLNSQATLVAIATDNGTVTIWDISQDSISYEFKHKNVNFITLSPNSKYLLSSAPFSKLKLWNLKENKLQAELVATPKILNWIARPVINATSVKFSNNEKYVIIAAPPRSIYIWDIKNFNLIRKWTIPKKTFWKPSATIIQALAISNDNKKIYLNSSNGSNYIINLN